MKVWLLPGLLAVCVACGGGGSGGTASLGNGNLTVDPEGIYTGTVVSTAAGNLTAFAVATPNGELRYAASNADLADVQLGNGTGTGTLYTPSGNSGLTLSGVAISPGANVIGSYSLTPAGDQGTFSFNYNSVYLRPLASLAGSYTSVETTSGGPFPFVLDSAGNVTGGSFTGTVVQLSATKNLYRLALTYTSNGNTFSGLGFWSDATSGLVPNTFYIQISGVNNSLALGAIFKPNT
jgi:hypothetical protein